MCRGPIERVCGATPAGVAAGDIGTKLCVRFGETEVPADRLLPGVLCCTVPPWEAPARVAVTVVVASRGALVRSSEGEPLLFEYRAISEESHAAA